MPEVWHVNYARALSEWESRGPHAPELLLAFYQFVLACMSGGPPDDMMQTYHDDELFVASIPGTRLTVSFLAVNQDKMMILKDIR